MKHLIILTLVFTSFSLYAKTEDKIIRKDTTVVEDSKVIYKVYQDQNYLYLNISTIDKKTVNSIIRSGLTVFFDVKGKEKENVYIKYPNTIEQPPRRQRGRSNDNEPTTKIALDSIIKTLPGEAEYGFYNEKVEFHEDLNTQDIALGFSNTGEIMEYDLKIPKDKILKDNKTDLSKLSIGIKTNEPERQNNQQPDESMKSRGGNRSGGGGRGGGMSGGRGGGNRGGGQSSGNNRPQRPTQDKANKVYIDFWFEAQLNAE